MISISLKQKGLTKKRISIAIIATVILIIVAIIILYFNKGDENILTKIPIDARSVLVINTSGISKKLFVDDFGKTEKSRTSLLKNIPDSLADIDFKNNGLSLTDKMVIFTMEDSAEISLNFVLKIEDNKAFKVFIDELGRKLNFKIENSDKVQIVFIPSFELLIVWDGTYLAGTKIKEKSDKKINFLKNTLKTDKKHSILSDNNFSSKIKNNYDLLFYSKPYKKNPFSLLDPVIADIESIASNIIFNDGELKINTEVKVKKGSLLDKLFQNTQTDFKTIEKEDSCIANIMVNVEPIAFNNLMSLYSSTLLKQKSIPYYKAWNGMAHISLIGFKSIVNEYITYDYDDDFNKIEIKKLRKNKVPDIKVISGIKPNVFDSILKTNQPVKNGKDTLLFAGSNYLIKKVGDKVYIYSLQTKMPLLLDETIKSQIYLELDYKKFLKFLDEFNIKMENEYLNQIHISNIFLILIKSETIEIDTKILFEDKDKNSLFILFDDIQEKK